MGKSTRDIKRFAYEQLRDFFVIALYLWIVFSLLVMFKSVVLAEQHIPFTYHGFAIINALALAKVMRRPKICTLVRDSRTRRSFAPLF